ncbi:asparagine synthase (glutamine-hydrolyzing) [Candidatus Peregrinibacteria bacterium]|nr:asparagine synthase (glutamine-hydrolyzing) [Candidatus Peregrinibacteria bacterium]
MCGICGLITTGTKPERSAIDGMNEALRHRGPDGGGIWIRENVALGHRRLAIIDPKGGEQPMGDDDGRLQITYNGELYNYRLLRLELERLGVRFHSDSDTEVVLKSYRVWGEECVRKFRGMFAFGIADFRERKLFLARDHFGIKPLLYCDIPGLFAFASELGALKTLPQFPRNPDLRAIDQFLWLQYIPAPRTAYACAKKLPPGHTLAVSFDGAVATPRSYVHHIFTPDHFRSGPEWLEALRAALDASVRAHCIADVPFGAFLSGGVDSSAVVEAMSRTLTQPVKTFTIAFREPEFDESMHAQTVAKACGTEHTVEVVEPDALGILPDLVQHYGEPFGDSSAVPTYYVSRLARASVPMVLSGDGGDEAFAGYNTYRSWMTLAAADRTQERWQSMIEYIGRSTRMQLWKEDFRDVVADRCEVFDDAFAWTRTFSPANVAQYMDLHTYLPNCILTKVDIASMMHGLEVRTPFTDTAIWRLALSIPERWNMRRGSDGQWEGKCLLKELLKDVLPQSAVKRPKQGFAVPIDRWFARGGCLHGTLQERLLASDTPLSQFFDPDAVSRILHGERSGPKWLLLVLDEWLRQEEVS